MPALKLDDEETRAIFLAGIRRGYSRTKACREVGLDPSQFRKRVKDDPVLAQEIVDAEEEYADSLEDKLSELAEEKSDKWAIKTLLRRRAPRIWGPVHDATGAALPAGSVTVQIGTVNVDSLDGVRGLKEALAARKEISTGVIDVESEELTDADAN